MTLPWPCLIRPAEPSDTGLVAHSWVESYYRGSRDVRCVKVSHYRQPMFRRVERVLASSSTLVACEPDDRDHLLGWVCWRGPTLHYVYVTQLRRSSGLMAALLDAADREGQLETYSHRTDRWMSMEDSRTLRFNPCALWHL